MFISFFVSFIAFLLLFYFAYPLYNYLLLFFILLLVIYFCVCVVSSVFFCSTFQYFLGQLVGVYVITLFLCDVCLWIDRVMWQQKDRYTEPRRKWRWEKEIERRKMQYERERVCGREGDKESDRLWKRDQSTNSFKIDLNQLNLLPLLTISIFQLHEQRNQRVIELLRNWWCIPGVLLLIREFTGERKIERWTVYYKPFELQVQSISPT